MQNRAGKFQSSRVFNTKLTIIWVLAQDFLWRLSVVHCSARHALCRILPPMWAPLRLVIS